MAKTQQDYQQEMAQLFCKAGEKQFMKVVYKRGLEDINNEINMINQEIENLQKAYRTFMARSTAAVATTAPIASTEAGPQESEIQETSASANATAKTV
jgi:hypothetical protein